MHFLHYSLLNITMNKFTHYPRVLVSSSATVLIKTLHPMRDYAISWAVLARAIVILTPKYLHLGVSHRSGTRLPNTDKFAGLPSNTDRAEQVPDRRADRPPQLPDARHICDDPQPAAITSKALQWMTDPCQGFSLYSLLYGVLPTCHKSFRAWLQDDVLSGIVAVQMSCEAYCISPGCFRSPGALMRWWSGCHCFTIASEAEGGE